MVPRAYQKILAGYAPGTYKFPRYSMNTVTQITGTIRSVRLFIVTKSILLFQKKGKLKCDELKIFCFNSINPTSEYCFSRALIVRAFFKLIQM